MNFGEVFPLDSTSLLKIPICISNTNKAELRSTNRPLGHNPYNCIVIPMRNTSCNGDRDIHVAAKKPITSNFVPSLLLSNTMSLAPKIDEIVEAVLGANIDIAMFTKTWLKESIPSGAINIPNYHLLRRDRKHKSHGGVCPRARA